MADLGKTYLNTIARYLSQELSIFERDDLKEIIWVVQSI